jgi:hypothetical protein
LLIYGFPHCSGHLPGRTPGNKRKYRSLASTFVAFNPEGNELLVNLGGEQIYLFPLTPGMQNTNKKFRFTESSSSCQVGKLHIQHCIMFVAFLAFIKRVQNYGALHIYSNNLIWSISKGQI